MSESTSFFSETRTVLWWPGWRYRLTPILGGVAGAVVIGPVVNSYLTGAVVGLLSGFVLWFLGLRHINKLAPGIVAEFREVSPKIGEKYLGVAGDGTATYSFEMQAGDTPGIETANEYKTFTLVVGDSSVAIHEGVSMNLKGRGTAVSDSTRELYYDQITSVSYGSGALKIGTSDGDTLRYPSTREPSDALADLQDRVRAYKTAS